jgi:PleD family two-component response regulator
VGGSGTPLAAAASVGVAPLPAGGASVTAETLAAADRLLYERKRERRAALVG